MYLRISRLTEQEFHEAVVENPDAVTLNQLASRIYQIDETELQRQMVYYSRQERKLLPPAKPLSVLPIAQGDDICLIPVSGKE